jgi:hypothetical protein
MKDRVRIILMLWLLFVACAAEGNTCVHNNIHQNNDSAKIVKVVDSLVKNGRNDLDKVRAIYHWISTHIYYDYERAKTLASNNFHDRSVDSIFILRKGICIDYSRLTKFMLSAAKIKCEIIEGHGRYADEDFFGTEKDLRHAWNAVFLNNKWLFLDVTWAAIQNIGDDTGSNFFLMEPKDFIYTHLPEDPQWALVQNPLTYEDFVRCPMVKNGFFRLVKSIPPANGIIVTDKDFITLDDLYFSKKVSPELDVEIQKVTNDKTEDSEYPEYEIVNQKEKPMLKIKLPEKGKFYVRIIAREKVEDNLFDDTNLITFLAERK